MARKTDDADVVSHVFSAELSAKTNLVRLLKKLILKLYVTESASCLVTCRWEGVIIVG